LARLRKVVPWAATIAGVVIGSVAGVAGVLLWPGVTGASFGYRVEVFLVIGLPIGAATFVFQRWYIPWMVMRGGPVRVRRLSVSDGRLRLELGDGRTFDLPLERVRVSSEPVAAGWHSVALFGGRVSTVFYVPGDIASRIRPLLPPAE